MQINSVCKRSAASSDLARLFGAPPSSPSSRQGAAPPGSTVRFLARFESTLPVSLKNAIAKIIDILAAQNPGAMVSGVADIQGSLVHIVAGGDAADTISYARGNRTSRAVTAYIDAGGGDDVIAFTSGVHSSHDIFGGSGNDTIAASAPWFGTVDGGDGNDTMSVSGEYVPMVTGGSGNDVIAVAGSVIANVDGGPGDDVIAVSGDYVVCVSGGDGNDTISVSSDNRRYFGTGNVSGVNIDGLQRPVMVDGGRGNDTISIAGEGYVLVRAGGGQDVINISDRTEFELLGKTWDDNSLNVKIATFANENGTLVVTFAGRDEKLTIRAPFGELQVELTGSQSFVVTPTSGSPVQ